MKASILFATIFFLLVISCNKASLSEIKVTSLKCNNLANPSGVDNKPQFKWKLSSVLKGQKQTSYRIIISSVKQNIKVNKGDIWDSGKISSAQSAWIVYNGPELKPGSTYFWKVCIWDKNDVPSEWSSPAFFITGLFCSADWGGAKWIGYEEIPDSLLLVPGVHGSGNNLGEVAKKRDVIPFFRKEFSTGKKIKKALIFVSGLGQYELYLNGKKIGDRFLSPGWTDYSKTYLYNTFDVTDYMRSRKNAIGLIVGNGFLNINRERYRKLVIAYGAPEVVLKLDIEYKDGSKSKIISDDSWKVAPSPITFSSIYGGEDYDARLEQPGWDLPGFNDLIWKNALIVKGPGGNPKSESDYPLKVMQEIKPVKILNPGHKTFIYDYEQNASGIIKLTVKGKPGQTVKLIPGELIDDDSIVTQKATGGPSYFSYILKGDKEEIWIPKFSYYGFRYVQVDGAVPSGYAHPDNLAVITDLKFLHTRNSSPETGSFKCSDELFNSIYKLIIWSIRSNLASVATDCPHREKLGWLEQTHLMGNSIKDIYDIHNLYRKIIDDMIEAQLENGLVPDIAPEYVPFAAGFRDSPEWGSACIILPWDMYKWYGDLDAVKMAYPMMKRYVEYLKNKAEKNILSHGLGDWYDQGPKFPGEAQLTPKAVTATSIYFYDIKLLSEMAELTGNNDEAQYYRQMAEVVRNAFNTRFFDKSTKVYSTGSQTAYAMPLFFGMVDTAYKKDVISNLIRSINDNQKALTAGDIGYRYLLRILENEGYSQLIYEMNSRTDVPGYGFQLSRGATSLTESWAALKYVSNNHMMLGHLMEWLYSGVGGIRQDENDAGFKKIVIAPEPVGDIKWAETVCPSVYGEIRCAWKITGDKFLIKISIPVNCTASVIVPQGDPGKISEGPDQNKLSENISHIESSGAKTRFNVLSGTYEFNMPFQK